MTQEERATLSLPKRPNTDTAEEDRNIPVGLFDVLLPSRQFVVHHKVAEVGQVALTTEFLLRLLYSVDGMEEEDVAQFFGFNAVEMAFVVNEAESRGYVYRVGGRIWLADAGHALFMDGQRPQILEVQRRTEKIGFDLLSMAPCERVNLSEFELALPELEIRDEQGVAMASQNVPDAFRRHYREIVGRKDRDPTTGVKRSLYSVDDVAASDRFSAVVPVLAMGSIRKPGEPEPMLDAWRAGHELDDRSAVVNAVAAFLDGLKTDKRTEDDHAYEVLLDIAPDYLNEYKTRSGLSAFRFFKETAARAGELRVDRPTVGIIGPLYSPENIGRVSAAIGYAATREPEANDGDFLWIAPDIAAWGASRATSALLDQIHGSETVITRGKPAKHLLKLFQKVLQRPDNGSIPAALEMLLIPGRVVAVTVHAPLSIRRGFPIPLGVLSFDPDVVKRAQQYLKTQLPQYIEIANSNDKFDLNSLLLRAGSPGEDSPVGNS